jgi:maltose O-acetyltransferase
MPVRLRLLARRGHRFGEWSRIRSGTLVQGTRLSVGRDTFINRDCLLEAAGPIVIGDEVHIGPRVHILTISHEIGEASRRAGERHIQPVRIGHGAWVGAGATILPGVTVGDGSVVAAGSLVPHDVASNTLVGGVPAKPLRELAG